MLWMEPVLPRQLGTGNTHFHISTGQLCQGRPELVYGGCSTAKGCQAGQTPGVCLLFQPPASAPALARPPNPSHTSQAQGDLFILAGFDEVVIFLHHSFFIFLCKTGYIVPRYNKVNEVKHRKAVCLVKCYVNRRQC